MKNSLENINFNYLGTKQSFPTLRIAERGARLLGILCAKREHFVTGLIERKGDGESERERTAVTVGTAVVQFIIISNRWRCSAASLFSCLSFFLLCNRIACLITAEVIRPTVSSYASKFHRTWSVLGIEDSSSSGRFGFTRF